MKIGKNIDTSNDIELEIHSELVPVTGCIRKDNTIQAYCQCDLMSIDTTRQSINKKTFFNYNYYLMINTRLFLFIPMGNRITWVT